MEIPKQITKSVDFRFYRSNLCTYGLLTLLFGVLSIYLGVSPSMRAFDALRIVLIVLTAVHLLFTLGNAVRLALLFGKNRNYKLAAAISTEHHRNPLLSGNTHYLVLSLEQPDGTKIAAESASVFRSSALSRCYFGNYINVPLKVLYDSDSEKLIVIGEMTQEN